MYEEISGLGFCEMALQVVLQIDPTTLKEHFSNRNFTKNVTKFIEHYESIQKNDIEGLHEDDINAILSLECASKCPASDEDIEKLIELIIPRISKV